MTEFFHNLSMQVFSVSNDEVILKFDTISALVKNIAGLLHNKINDSIDAKTQKSEKLASSLREDERTVEKTIMNWVIDSFHKNKVINLSDNFKLATISSGEENKKQQEDFIDTSLIFNCEDFKTAENINEEGKRKLFKTVVDPNEGLLVNDQLGIDDWNPPDTNTNPLTRFQKNHEKHS